MELDEINRALVGLILAAIGSHLKDQGAPLIGEDISGGERKSRAHLIRGEKEFSMDLFRLDWIGHRFLYRESHPFLEQGEMFHRCTRRHVSCNMLFKIHAFDLSSLL